MMHPLNMAGGGWIEIITSGGARRASTRRYKVGKSSVFAKHVGKVVRIIYEGDAPKVESANSLVGCALETAIFSGSTYDLATTILLTPKELDPIETTAPW